MSPKRVRVGLVFLWAILVLPELVQVATTGGRGGEAGGGVFSATTVRLILTLGLFLIVLDDCLAGHRANMRLQNGWMLPILITTGSIVIGFVAGDTWVLTGFVAALASVWCRSVAPSSNLFRTLVMLCVITALIAIAMIPTGLGFATDWQWGSEKAIIGNYALAGPFGHASGLGATMAVGLSLLPLAHYKGWKTGMIAATLAVVLILSSTRIAIAAAITGALVALLVRRGRGGHVAAVVAIGTVGVAMALLPLVGFSDEAFTNRGWIWRIARTRFRESPLIGSGVTEVTPDGIAGDIIARAAEHAHSTFLGYLLFGGLLFAAIMVWLFTRLVRGAVLLGDGMVTRMTFFMVTFAFLAAFGNGSLIRPSSYAFVTLPIVFIVQRFGARMEKARGVVRFDRAVPGGNSARRRGVGAERPSDLITARPAGADALRGVKARFSV